MMKKICLAVAATIALSACTTNPYTGERETSKAAIGSGLGALAGAVIGGISSGDSDRSKGVLIGAASGAALGGGVGYYMDVQEAKLRDQMRGTGVSVSRNGDNIVLNMPSSITFAVDSADLSPSFYNTLSGVAMVLKEYDKTYVNVVGHT
ncbi:MAG: glycine zipper domain-containing protein, partial [Oceanisphaera sp.]|nr:glycine zipper domain-containing protein [Oceanisphaera sp.]